MKVQTLIVRKGNQLIQFCAHQYIYSISCQWMTLNATQWAKITAAVVLNVNSSLGKHRIDLIQLFNTVGVISQRKYLSPFPFPSVT